MAFSLPNAGAEYIKLALPIPLLDSIGPYNSPPASILPSAPPAASMMTFILAPRIVSLSSFSVVLESLESFLESLSLESLSLESLSSFNNENFGPEGLATTFSDVKISDDVETTDLPNGVTSVAEADEIKQLENNKETPMDVITGKTRFHLTFITINHIHF